MGIYNEKEDVMQSSMKPEKPVDSGTQYIDPRIQEKQRFNDIGNYHSALVNTTYIDIRSLLSHVGGASWTVDYFLGIKDKDDEAVQHTEELGGAYQQYWHIVGLELKVQQNWDSESNFDLEQGEFNPEGKAIIYAKIRPNVGDCFVADIGDGRLAEIGVTNVTPKSYLKDTVYEIDYTVTRYLDNGINKSLLTKTIMTYYFEIEDVMNGGTGLLSAESVMGREYLVKAKEALSHYHMISFHDHEVESLILPYRPLKVYDMFVPKVMNQLLNREMINALPSNRVLDCTTDETPHLRTIWDVLLTNDIHLFPLIFKGYGSRQSYTFEQLPELCSVAYSGVNEVVYPEKHILMPQCTVCHNDKGTPEPLDGQEPQFTGDKVRMYPLHFNNAYILSDYFYDRNRKKMSVFEVMLMEYLHEKAVNVKQLISFIEEVHTEWSEEQRFYLIPMLIILINVSLQQRGIA